MDRSPPKTAVLQALRGFNQALAKTVPAATEASSYVLQSSFAVLSYSGTLTQMTLEEFVNRKVKGGPRAAPSNYQRFDNSVQVWVHERVAAVWASHEEVSEDSSFVKCERRLYGLAYVEDRWKISGIASTDVDPSDSQSTPAPDIMAPVDALLTNFSDPDWKVLQQWFLPKAGCTLLRPPAEPLEMSLEQSIVRLQDMIKGNLHLAEKLHDVEIRAHGDLAVVWAPFVVEVNRVPRHRGVNIFTMIKKEDRWVFGGCQDYGVPIDG